MSQAQRGSPQYWALNSWPWRWTGRSRGWCRSALPFSSAPSQPPEFLCQRPLLLQDGHSNHLFVISLDTPTLSQPTFGCDHESHSFYHTGGGFVWFGSFLGAWNFLSYQFPTLSSGFIHRMASEPLLPTHLIHTIYFTSILWHQDLKHPFAKLTSPTLPGKYPLCITHPHSTSMALISASSNLPY